MRWMIGIFFSVFREEEKVEDGREEENEEIKHEGRNKQERKK